MMDVNKLLNTIDIALALLVPHNKEVSLKAHDAKNAVTDLRTTIVTLQQMLDQAQTIANQQQTTLERVETERRAYREFYQMMVDEEYGHEQTDWLALIEQLKGMNTP